MGEVKVFEEKERPTMVAPPTIYSNAKPTVHDCKHLDTCEYLQLGERHHVGERFRICRTCGEKDRVLNMSSHHFSVLNRPESMVTMIGVKEYLAIERSFDQKSPEYRARVFRQVHEAIAAHVLVSARFCD